MDAQPLIDVAALRDRAEEFAADLSRTVQAVAGPTVVFKADGDTEGERLEAVIRQAGEGIPLTRGGEVVLTLEVEMWLIPDHQFRFLKTRTSRFAVYPVGKNNPVFRYEFDQELEAGRRPAAHVQFHGRHPELEEAMRATRQGKPRGRRTDPQVSKLHFPVGGSRFRPCLEDVLEMLIHEFDIDPQPDKAGALEALARGRRDWRGVQLRAAVRDDPGTAVEALRSYGYEVTWRGPHLEPNARVEHLRRL